MDTLRLAPDALPRPGQDQPAARSHRRGHQPRPHRSLVRRPAHRTHPHIALRRPCRLAGEFATSVGWFDGQVPDAAPAITRSGFSRPGDKARHSRPVTTCSEREPAPPRPQPRSLQKPCCGTGRVPPARLCRGWQSEGIASSVMQTTPWMNVPGASTSIERSRRLWDG